MPNSSPTMMYCQIINSDCRLRSNWTNRPPFAMNSIASANAPNGTSTAYVIIPNPPQASLDYQAVNNVPSSPKRNYKTELCKNFEESRYCRYGSKCNFAHGKDELARFSSAYEMYANGLIENPDTYLSRPCFDYVATGACPMDTRCNSLHDPRVAGSNPSWLKQWIKPKSSLGVMPDGLHYHRDLSRFQTNPLVDFNTWKVFGNFGSKTEMFDASYDLVCNVRVPVFNRGFVVRKCPHKISDEHKLAIVRVMLTKNAVNRNFVYSNKKSLNDQPCMVLQTRYFLLTDPKAGTAVRIEDIVREVSAAEYDPGSSLVVKADEIVFESKGMHGCNHSIWFNVIISNHGGKNGYGANMKRNGGEAGHLTHDRALFVMPENKKFQQSLPADTPFILMQPKDDCAEGYDLIDAILKHRIGAILTSKNIHCNWEDNLADLNADFARLQNSHEKWIWPAHTGKIVGSDQIYQEYTSNKYVPAPNDDSKYSLSSMWSQTCANLDSKFDSGVHETTKPRLDVFVSISIKTEKDCKEIPHITNSSTKKSTAPLSDVSESTWKELLVEGDGPWNEALRAHNSGRIAKGRSSSYSSL